ncbi:hypothetical protein MAP00_006292 [Monascus purpureus]|nr:hypothetical protein MAP00_006292 [Monascus purpureus]
MIAPSSVNSLYTGIIRFHAIRIYTLQRPWQRRTISSCATATATTQKQSEPETNTKADTTPRQNDPSTPSLSDQVRLLMRQVPYPVAIITATDPHAHPERAFRGMTVSSFNTVSLNPDPVVSFNVRRPSETLNAILSSGRFLVHLLAPSDATAALARDFSRGNNHLSILAGEGPFEFAHHYSSDLNGEVEGEIETARPLPVLRRKGQGRGYSELESFPFVFECRLHPQRVEVHDHTIVLGKVVRTLREQRHHLIVSDGGDDSSSSRNDSHQTKGENAPPESLCLTYANTRFWKMGHEI